MPDVALVKQKIEDGKESRLREWMAEVREREEEALETLENEGMHSESAFVEHTDDGDFLIYYLKADDVDRALEAHEESSHELDEQHRRVMDEVIEGGSDTGEYELLYHLENPQRP
jgi:hypothetical protein